MYKNFSVVIKSFIMVLIVGMLFVSGFVCCEAIEVSPDDTVKIDSAVKVSDISFDKILKKAKEHSYDLQIAELSKLISRQDIRAARSDYYPKLNFSAGTEYTKNFRDVRSSIVTTVGDSFINPYTRYQSIMGITLSYNIFDFGVRRGHLDIAKEDEKLKDLEEKEKLQDLYLNLLDTYTKVLVLKKQIDLNQRILGLQSANLDLKNRLYHAKEISSTDLNDAKVKVEDLKRSLNEITSMLNENLLMLSFYTGEDYDVDNLKVGDVKRSSFDTTAFQDYTKSIVWQVHEIQLKKKELELKVVKRTNLPKITAYGRYYLYGSDHSSYSDSFSDFQPSNYTVGGTLNMPLFDGFKNYSDIKKTEVELKSLQIERDKAIAEYMTRLATLRSNLLYSDAQVNNANLMIKELEEKEKSKSRLLSKKLITPIELNEAKIETLERKIEFEKYRVTSAAIVKSIEILTEAN